MKAFAFVASLFLIVLVACTPEPVTITETVEVTVEVEVVNDVEVTRIVTEEVEVTRLIVEEVTRIVEEVVEIEVTQTPTAQPQQFITLDGTGNTVSDNYDLQDCQKAVFSWTADGESNFIVYIWKAGIDDNRLLINEIAPTSGEALQPLTGGTYWLTVDATGSWSIMAECRD